jgi:hypothetical protein
MVPYEDEKKRRSALISPQNAMPVSTKLLHILEDEF